MASKGKTFSNAFAREPAKMFISDTEETAEKASATEEAPEIPERKAPVDDAAPIVRPYAHEKPETKSRRLQLLVKPSTYASIKAEADELDMSLNELVNAILERHAGR